MPEIEEVGVATVLRPGSSLLLLCFAGRGAEWNGLWSHPAHGHQQASELDDGVFTIRKLRVESLTLKTMLGYACIGSTAKTIVSRYGLSDGKSLLSSLADYS